MIIQLSKSITEGQKEDITQAVLHIPYKPNVVATQFGNYLVCIGKKEFDIRKIGFMPGVFDIHRVTSPYKLVSRQWKVDDTVIDLGNDIKIKRGDLAIMAGPCTIESFEHA